MGVISHKQQADRPEQPRRPAAPGAVEEQRGQNLVAEDDDQHHAQHGLRDLREVGRPRCGARSKSTAPNSRAMMPERKLLQHRGGDGGVLAAQAELRLDCFFPGVEILLHFAGENLAELGVDAADVGGQRLDGGRKIRKKIGEWLIARAPAAARLRCRQLLLSAGIAPCARSMRPCGRPSRARRARSRRAISPASVSWS